MYLFTTCYVLANQNCKESKMSSTGEESSEIVDFATLAPEIQNQILEAIKAREAAYCQYSNFAVGACLECEDGTLYNGCNVENAVLGLSICAERTALVKAISEGRRKFKSIAVIGQQEKSFTTPCGSCRQFMSEFNKEMPVYVTKPTLEKVLVTSVRKLLPYMFEY